MKPLLTGENFWKKIGLHSTEENQDKSDAIPTESLETETVLEQIHDTIRNQYYNESITDAFQLSKFAGLTNVYGLLILVSMIGGMLFLILTRFEHPYQIVAYYDEREAGLNALAPFQTSARVGGIAQQKDVHQTYIALIERKLQTDPDNAELRYYLGVCYFRTRKLKEATQLFSALSQEATPLISQKSEYRLGLTLWQSEQYAAAKAVFKKIGREPHHAYREKAHEILKEEVFRSL